MALDGSSPFYRQRRIGRNGYVFSMLKIRSMVPNAHERLEHLLASDPAARAEWESTQKLKKDPRITLFGKILRKSLEASGVETRPLFGSIPTQQRAYAHLRERYAGRLPQADYLGRHAFYVGCHQYLSPEGLQIMVGAFHEALGGRA